MLSRICVFLTGFKPSRIREWRTAVQNEARAIGWRVLAGELAKGALGLGGVSKSRWRARIRACRACPVHDRKTKQCLTIVDGERLGCGCYMPVKAMVRKNACWLRALGDQSHGFD